MAKLVVYCGNDEIIVTTKKNEARMLAEYFHAKTGRKVEDYDRNVKMTIRIASEVVVSGD